jgi:hypothetical protein
MIKCFFSHETTPERTGLRSKISHVCNHIQNNLFPFPAEELGPPTESQQDLWSDTNLFPDYSKRARRIDNLDFVSGACYVPD